MNNYLTFALVAMLPAGAVHGEDPWLELKLTPRTKVVVVDVDGKLREGLLRQLTAESVVLDTEAEPTTLSREQVAVIRRAGAFDNLQTVYAPWDNIARIGYGQRVRVYRSGGLMVEGTLAARTAEGLRVESWDKTRFIEKGKIRKVRVLIKGHDDTGAKIGAAIGFLAGVAALAAIASGGGSGEICDPTGGLVGGAALGGMAGDGIATLFDEYQTIYVSKRP